MREKLRLGDPRTMFKSIAVRPTWLLKPTIDIGALAESLLFYQNTHLLLNEGELAQLTKSIGIDSLLALLEAGHAQVLLLRDSPATHQRNSQVGSVYDYVVVERLRSDRNVRAPLEIVQEAFRRATGRAGKSRRSAHRFLRFASVGSINDGISHEHGVSELSRKDIEDPTYVRAAIEASLYHLLGGRTPLDWRFEIDRSPEGLRISSDLDFAAITNRHRSLFGGDTELSPALLADFLHQARVDLVLAARLESELLSSSVSSDIIKLRLQNAIAGVSSQSRVADVQLFQNVVLDGRTVGEVIRSGEKKFDELLQLLDEARKFKDWLVNQPDEANVVREYYEAISRGTWIEKLPGKGLRFILFTGLGFAADAILPTGLGTATGVSIGAADTFLLDRLLRGWKPNQFVERSLKPFVGVRPPNTGPQPCGTAGAAPHG